MPRKVDRLDRIEQLLERSFEGIGRLENSLDRTIEKLDRSIERLDGTDEKLDRTAEKLDRVAEKLDHVAEQVSKNTEQLARHSEQLAKHSDQIDEIHELQKVAFQWMNRESAVNEARFVDMKCYIDLKHEELRSDFRVLAEVQYSHGKRLDRLESKAS